MELIRCEADPGDLDMARGHLLSVNFPVTEIQNKVKRKESVLEEVSSCPIQFDQVQTKVETRHLTDI